MTAIAHRSANLSKVVSLEEKRCRGCHESWPLDKEFWHASKSSRDGLRATCKACVKERDQRKAQGGLYKACRICKQSKPCNAANWMKDARRKDGLSITCRACTPGAVTPKTQALHIEFLVDGLIRPKEKFLASPSSLL